MSTRIFALLGGGCAALAAGLLWFGSYTERTTVTGVLQPDRGLVHVHVPHSGVIRSVHVGEGDVVHRGAPLFALLTEQRTSIADDTRGFIAHQIENRTASLEEQLKNVERLKESRMRLLEKQIDSAQAELEHLDAVIATQRARLEAREATLAGYEKLLAEGLMSQDLFAAKREEVFDLRLSLSLLERDRANVLARAEELREELRSVPLDYRNQTLELARSVAAAAQELGLNELDRALLVTAPESGTVAAMHAKAGQSVTPDAPVATLVPEGSKLQALLYVPSSAIAFLDEDDVVLLRYDAYPYRRYGQHEGTIARIEPLVMPPEPDAGAGAQREPVLRVIVDLPSQTLHASGKELPLYPGMPLQAEIVHDTRRLWDWVFGRLRGTPG